MCPSPISLMRAPPAWVGRAQHSVLGYDAGLTDEGVPALSDQSENRERCRALISGMDFDALAERSEYREDLMFPAPSELPGMNAQLCPNS